LDLAATDGSLTSALRLYQWNAEVSSAFHEALHYVEVGLRNAMEKQLAAWAIGLGAPTPWYRDRLVPLTPPTRRKVEDARSNATRNGQTEVHGTVVAELMLGFWWSLLSDEYNRRLWQPCLRFAFDGPVRRTRLHSSWTNCVASATGSLTTSRFTGGIWPETCTVCWTWPGVSRRDCVRVSSSSAAYPLCSRIDLGADQRA
jgi:hypothetical protein